MLDNVTKERKTRSVIVLKTNTVLYALLLEILRARSAELRLKV
jgi:hypothetical protein